MTHRTDRILTSIIGLTEGLTTKLPAARDQLNRTINAIDGYPVGTDSPKVTASSELTTVENAAHQRIRLQEERMGIDIALNGITTALAELHRACDRIIGRQPVARCTGGQGRSGSIEWGDANCWSIPSRNGLCDACYQRERRWRILNGMPTREVA